MTQYFRLNTPPSPWHRAADVAGQVWEQHQEQKRQEELQRQQEEERRREAQEYQQRLALEVILPTLSQQGRADVGQAIGRGESPWMDPNWVPDQKLPMTQKELPKPQEREPGLREKLMEIQQLYEEGLLGEEEYKAQRLRLAGYTSLPYGGGSSGGGGRGGGGGSSPSPTTNQPAAPELTADQKNARLKALQSKLSAAEDRLEKVYKLYLENEGNERIHDQYNLTLNQYNKAKALLEEYISELGGGSQPSASSSTVTADPSNPEGFTPPPR